MTETPSPINRLSLRRSQHRFQFFEKSFTSVDNYPNLTTDDKNTASEFSESLTSIPIESPAQHSRSSSLLMRSKAFMNDATQELSFSSNDDLGDSESCSPIAISPKSKSHPMKSSTLSLQVSRFCGCGSTPKCESKSTVSFHKSETMNTTKTKEYLRNTSSMTLPTSSSPSTCIYNDHGDSSTIHPICRTRQQQHSKRSMLQLPSHSLRMKPVPKSTNCCSPLVLEHITSPSLREMIRFGEDSLSLFSMSHYQVQLMTVPLDMTFLPKHSSSLTDQESLLKIQRKLLHHAQKQS
jgi:hypothetical protein